VQKCQPQLIFLARVTASSLNGPLATEQGVLKLLRLFTVKPPYVRHLSGRAGVDFSQFARQNFSSFILYAHAVQLEGKLSFALQLFEGE